MKKTLRSLLSAVLALVMCMSAFVGTTFAWFTDSVSSMNNIIKAGNLDIEMYWTEDLSTNSWVNVEDDGAEPLFNYDNWEPGYTQVRYVRIVNAGSLAFKYMMNIIPTGEVGILADVIDVSYDIVTDNTEFKAPKAEDKAGSLRTVGSLRDVIYKNGIVAQGVLLPDGEDKAGYYDGEVVVCVSLHMQEKAGNEYQNKSVGDAFDVQLIATQFDYENDSFGNGYDTEAEWPENPINKGTVSASADVEVDANGYMTQDVSLESEDGSVKVSVPAGTKLKPGVDKITMTVTPKEESEANIVVKKDTEVIKSYDIHLEGVAEDNQIPAKTYLPEFMPAGLNNGNYSLYHVEGGNTNAMNEDDVDHNGFIYEPEDGDLYLYLKGYSEVALVSDLVNPWKGTFNYDWYDANETEFVISNADQLAAFGAIVGGMNGQTQDSFTGKTVTLNADINLGDKDNANENLIFYPIGYYNNTGSYEKVSGGSVTSSVNSFEGTFDGNGHIIANFYQNTWEMFGDYNNGYTGTPNHYKDAMGLFGYVVNGKVTNLTVDNFSSDGEFTPTGVIAAYAVNSTFENIAIVNCNPRVYNTGNGGIVGIGGNSDDPDEYKLTFNNITIDNSNKITALWGSWDVACGGLVGMFRGDGHAYMTNCHVAAQIDVYNDVCGNYQYYWYRYSGMMIGTNKNMTTDANGYTVPETDKFHAENCTVHFGDWNDYYYCELVANSLASYTHDHQFSRLEQISSLDEIKSGDTWTKTGNFLLIEGDTKTCYHIVKNADGTLKQHLHTDKGYEDGIDEDGDGENDLKEDKQIVYLPFNQLFTGYGWGVKHIPVYNGEDYAFEGITILDREVADSVDKFSGLVNELANDTEIKIGNIFAYVDKGVGIKPGSLTVTVTDLDDTDGTVTATFTRDVNDWTNGILELTGTGNVEVTIQDYYFCTPTTITVLVKEADDITPVDRFDVVFPNTNTYLYRVGNQNNVPLNNLFTLTDSNVGAITIKTETVAGNATAADLDNADLSNGNLKFTGTGVVAVTISDDNFSKPVILNLEVVDAKNITSAAGSNGTDVVLLNDVTISSNGTANYTNCVVYGNGFTFDVRGGMNQYNSKQGHGIIITSGATLDNLVILGDVYDTYGAYTTQEDYTGAVDATNTIIQNCHISNCATPVRANGVTIKNTTLYGGTVANLIISGGTNTLEDVTTVNYDDKRGILGFGIVISDGANENVKLVLNGELKQHNFVCADDVNSVPDDNAKKLFNAMFDSAYSTYHFGTDPVYVNPGILSMVSTFDSSDITDNTGNGYTGMTVSYNTGLGTATGYLYSLPASGNSVDNNYDETNDAHKAMTQGDYLPTFYFDLGDQAISNEGADDTRYLEGDASGIKALYQSNESPITLDLTRLANVYKYTGVEYKVSVSYKDSNGNVLGTDTTVSLTSSGTLVFTVTDNVFYDASGKKLDKSVEIIFEVPLTVSVKQASVKNAELKIEKTTLTGTYTAAGTFDTSQYLSFNPLEALTVTDYDANGTGTTVDLTANISTTTVTYVNSTSGAWGGATITITYTDGRELTIVLGSTTMNSPGSSNGGKTITVTNGTVKSDGKVAKSSATGGTWPIASYSFKGNSGSTVKINETVTVIFADTSGCVTGDTLVTLADGSQKRIDQVSYDDQLLVWNFFEGKYDVVPSAIIFYHGDANYRVLNLNFEDGTTVKVINNHGFFDVENNQFVFIEEANVEDYIGHHFVKVDGESYKSVELVGYEITEEYTGCYSIQSAVHNNFMTEGMFSLTIPHYEGWFDYFEIGEGMKYDEEKMQADIAEYGLYTYEDFAEYVTYEQFVAFNGPYLKVLVGKGVVTYDQIIDLISMYVNP